MKKILVIGSNGQLGTELFQVLSTKFGSKNVIASDISAYYQNNGLFEQLDACDAQGLAAIVQRHKIQHVYHLAAILSAKGEHNPVQSWDLNMKTLLNVLELGRKGMVERIFWPSSIAVFGPDTPKEQTDQHAVTNPNTVYGISKLAGEKWCQYYFDKFGVDVRSVRYPGLVGHKAMPGGGTTDYAIEIFHKAVLNQSYDCFLGPESSLPMMYMDDAIRATLLLMEAPSNELKIRTSYNLSGLSFTPAALAAEIQIHYPNFQVNYKPDFRQAIADSWPSTIDDRMARMDWHWQQSFDLPKMTLEMLKGLQR